MQDRGVRYETGTDGVQQWVARAPKSAKLSGSCAVDASAAGTRKLSPPCFHTLDPLLNPAPTWILAMPGSPGRASPSRDSRTSPRSTEVPSLNLLPGEQQPVVAIAAARCYADKDFEQGQRASSRLREISVTAPS
jgi:hypothetical protein